MDVNVNCTTPSAPPPNVPVLFTDNVWGTGGGNALQRIHTSTSSIWQPKCWTNIAYAFHDMFLRYDDCRRTTILTAVIRSS
jgi:hypothetical protein